MPARSEGRATGDTLTWVRLLTWQEAGHSAAESGYHKASAPNPLPFLAGGIGLKKHTDNRGCRRWEGKCTPQASVAGTPAHRNATSPTTALLIGHFHAVYMYFLNSPGHT